MRKKLSLVFWFLLAAATWGSEVALGLLLLEKQELSFGRQFLSKSPTFQFAPAAWADYSQPEITSVVVAADSRKKLLRAYLERYHSPLAPFASLIYDVSLHYGLDYRLLVAIAQQESNLCKKAPPGCYNCWGMGIHSRGKLCFSSYPEAIERVARYLREEYYDKGLTTPEEIMKKYCPLSDGSWAAGVRQFMEEIENP